MTHPLSAQAPNTLPPANSARADEVVVLVHGIWMTDWIFAVLTRRLRRDGFRCAHFRYASVSAGCAENIQRLQDFLQTLPYPVVHFVAHSLGGLLVRQLFHYYPRQKPGRIVTLGTPHQGSSVARHIYLKPRLRQWLLGKCLDMGLLGDAPPWLGQRSLGNIAGTRGMGLGRLAFSWLEQPNDGTVAVAETYLPEASEWLTLSVSHTGLVFSREAARQTSHFLRTGEFIRMARDADLRNSPNQTL